MSNAADEAVVLPSDGSLFPVMPVPSFYEVAGAHAAVHYYNARQSLDEQELRRARRRAAEVHDR